jgi:hypothetical protein
MFSGGVTRVQGSLKLDSIVTETHKFIGHGTVYIGAVLGGDIIIGANIIVHLAAQMGGAITVQKGGTLISALKMGGSVKYL